MALPKCRAGGGPVFLAWWVQNHAVQQEIDAATDKHPLVARNMTAAFARYCSTSRPGSASPSAMNSGAGAFKFDRSRRRGI
jgi:hypothetical protein